MEKEIYNGIACVSGIEMPYARITRKNRTEMPGKTPGKTLVIIPGLSVRPVSPMATAIAGRYALFLENGYDIYVFDRRSNYPAGYTVPDMAEDTAVVMKYLEIEKADIFGASMGGMISMGIAIAHPELAEHLLFGSTAAKPSDCSLKLMENWISLVKKKDEKGLNEAFGSAVYSKSVWEKFGEGITAANTGITDEEYSRFLCMVDAIIKTDLRERLKDIKSKTLVIGSKGDKIFPSPCSEIIAENAGCELFLYDESFGHGVYDEAPDYVERLYSFCSR